MPKCRQRINKRAKSRETNIYSNDFLDFLDRNLQFNFINRIGVQYVTTWKNVACFAHFLDVFGNSTTTEKFGRDGISKSPHKDSRFTKRIPNENLRGPSTPPQCHVPPPPRNKALSGIINHLFFFNGFLPKASYFGLFFKGGSSMGATPLDSHPETQLTPRRRVSWGTP